VNATIFIGAVIALGAVALTAGIASFNPATVDPILFLLLLGLAALAQRVPVALFRSGSVSVSFAAAIAAYVLYGAGAGVLVNLAAAAVAAVTPTRKPLSRIAYNTATLTISAYFAGATYTLVGGEVPPGPIVPTMFAVAVSALVYFAVNSSLVAAAIALTEGLDIWVFWRQQYGWTLVNFLATSLNGAALAVAYQALEIFGVLTFMLPLGVAWYSFNLYMTRSAEVRKRNDELQIVNAALQQTNARLEESNLSVIGALVGALEAKDNHTHGHSAATMFHAVAVSRKLGLAEDEIAAVQLGALFHDIGKIGIPEEIFRKPDRLTDQEWTEMKAHPVIGANLLAHMPTLAKVRPIVLAHHERFDGTGYPNGLRGEQIPLAAQIIAVADAYQAMTSSRPYRPALQPKQAMRELRVAAGTQFNPVVVEAFITTLTDERRRQAHGYVPQHEHKHAYQQAVEAARLSH
jgi:putative nucleotidyltransferase with HDIG domain